MRDQSEYHREYYKKNKARIIARTTANAAKWRLENPELSAERLRAYAVVNAEKIATRRKAQRDRDREAVGACAREYHRKNAAIRNAKSREWHAENKEHVLDRQRKWCKDNPGACAAKTRKRDAIKLRATPAWVDYDKILAIYAESARLTRETGIRHEVDHIYPLQGRVVCGLHVHTNLQILKKSDNCAKHNRMPEDWLAMTLQAQ